MIQFPTVESAVAWANWWAYGDCSVRVSGRILPIELERIDKNTFNDQFIARRVAR